MITVDRIDNRGNIRAHLARTADAARTACGIEIGMRQSACGNAMCRKCQAMLDMLAGIRDGSIDFYIHGASAVAAARGLAHLGLIELEDNGPMVILGRSDRERWSVRLTAAGADPGEFDPDNPPTLTEAEQRAHRAECRRSELERKEG